MNKWKTIYKHILTTTSIEKMATPIIHIPGPEELRKLRKMAGLSQRELAKLAGVSQSLIAKIEKGSINPRLKTLEKILKVIEERLSSRDMAKNIMQTPVITARPSTRIIDVIKVMEEKGISQVPVVDDNNMPIGTIYESTIMKALLKGGKKASNYHVKDVMEDPLPTVTETTTLQTIVQLLLEHPAVLVVSKKGVIGIITKIDVIKYVLQKLGE